MSAIQPGMDIPSNIVSLRMVDLCRLMERYLSEEDAATVYRAFLLAAEAHDGIFRKSGEPYITHPIKVALILADLHMDAHTLSAAILHDVIEDTPYTYDDIKGKFGDKVADLVEGVTKLSSHHYESKQAAGIASFHKMMQAMVKDYRVVLIKLADRLHNVSTLGSMPPSKQRRIAKETLEIHVPLARRMGMNKLRHKLQMHAFQSMYPLRSKVIQRWWDNCLEEKKQEHNTILLDIGDALEEEKIKGAIIFPWKKNLFRLYQKERQRKSRKHFDRNDLSFDIRIITRTPLDCYKALGIVHQLFHPKVNTFRDFIATPKVYGFQALQTTLITNEQQVIRIQIQSKEMYQVAQYGIASQWLFPHLSADQQLKISQRRLNNWLEQVAEIQQAPGDVEDFLEDMKAEFFFHEVSVLTPKGDSKILRVGATPIDFAYAIHTNIGHHCIGARINGSKAPLNTRLHDGATVEIITDKTALPSPAWLNFAVTGKARAAIRSWLARRHSDEFIQFGKNLLDRAISNFGVTLENITPNSKKQVLKALELNDENALYSAIANGSQCSKLVARRLLNNAGLQTLPETTKQPPLFIKGTEGLALTLQSCCHPIPSDTIVAEIKPQIGLEVHRADCPSNRHNAKNSTITLAWSKGIQQDFEVALQIQAKNKVGALFNITNTLQKHGFNIEDININGDKNIKELRLLIKVKNNTQLQTLFKNLEEEEPVISAKRLFNISSGITL